MLEKSKLLIVDDRPENLYALEEALKEADVEIVKANGGNEALKASLIHDFALMILDVNMPEMDGFELAGILRDREETKHVPLIFVTGVYKEYDSLFKGYKTGAVDYILKPVDTDMLLSKVRVFVELDRQKRELAESNRRLLLEIAERERAEAESRRAKDAAEAANRAKSDFLANMSHELRTPLHAILGYSQLHGDDPNLTPEQKGDLATIRRRGEHLLVLINQVLDLSNLEKGRVEAVEINFDLHEFLDEMEEVYQPHAREKGIAPRFQRAPNVPRYARADAVKLRQVLINLLNNAFKYTE
ncbi:MAG: response regulator, partial [Desulfobacterales bacterium]|nr:response regulator [Desulfobacterales bacterium]